MLMYTVWAKHPDDNMVRVVLTPWKPELMEICEKLLHAARGDIDDVAAVCIEAEAAIAKARGEG